MSIAVLQYGYYDDNYHNKTRIGLLLIMKMTHKLAGVLIKDILGTGIGLGLQTGYKIL